MSLAPGEWKAYPISTCLQLHSGNAGDRYRVAVTRPTQVENAADVTNVTLTVTSLGVHAAPPTSAPSSVVTSTPARRAPIPGLSLATLARSVATANANDRYEADLRRNEVELLQHVPLSGLLKAHPRPPTQKTLSVRSGAQGTLATGSTTTSETLPDKLGFQQGTPSNCVTDTATVAGILVYQNDDMAIYQDSAQRVTKPIGEADAKRMTDYYSAYARDMVLDYFGENPDVDGNGKEIVFASPVVSGNYAAWVWSGNYFDKASCPASNERDLIFFNTDLIRAMDDADPNWQALETVSHESKHIVSLYNRLAYGRNHLDSNPYHPLWIEEGTAEISGSMSSRIAWAANGGPPVGGRVTRDDFVKSGITPEDYGVVLRMARTVSYLSSQPNGLIVAPQGAADGSNIYASGWHFERWLGDAYGGASTSMADATLFHAMNDSMAAEGTAGLQEQTGKSFYELFDEFVAANLSGENGGTSPRTRLHQLRLRHGRGHPPGPASRGVSLARDHDGDGGGRRNHEGVRHGAVGGTHRRHRNPHPRPRVQRNRHGCVGQEDCGTIAADSGRSAGSPLSADLCRLSRSCLPLRSPETGVAIHTPFPHPETSRPSKPGGRNVRRTHAAVAQHDEDGGRELPARCLPQAEWSP